MKYAIHVKPKTTEQIRISRSTITSGKLKFNIGKNILESTASSRV